MKKIAAFLAWLALTANVAGQTFPGELPAGNVVGNPTSSTGIARPTTVSALFDQAYCSTIGFVIVRFTSVWTCTAGYPANPVWWGADPTGVADSAAAFTAALAASNRVSFPPGTFKFNSQITKSVLAGASVTIDGAGQDVTILNWVSTNGLLLQLATPASSFHVKGLTFTCATTGCGTGLQASLTTGSANPAGNATSDISYVTLRGSDGYIATNFWTTGISIVGVSNLNVIGVSDYGPTGVGGSGTGMSIVGLVGATQYAVAIQIIQSQFQQRNVGLNLTSYWQGVQVFESQFIGDKIGIFVPAGSLGNLDVLIVRDTIFNIQGTACGVGNGCLAVSIQSPVFDTTFAGNEFAVQPANGIGLQIGSTSARCAITNNQFLGATVAAQLAMSFINTASSCVINGNNLTLGAWASGINLAAGTVGFLISLNDFANVTTPITNASTDGTNRIMDNRGYNPVGTTAGTSTGVSASVIVAGPVPETHYVFQSANFNAVVAKCTAAACASSTNICTVATATVPCVLQLGPNEFYKVTWATTQPTYTKDIH